MMGGLVLDLLFTVGATFALFGKLRLIEDMFDVSLEIRRVGTLVLLALGKQVRSIGLGIFLLRIWKPPCAHNLYPLLLVRTVLRTVGRGFSGWLCILRVGVRKQRSIQRVPSFVEPPGNTK